MDDSGIGLGPLILLGVGLLGAIGGVILRDRQVMQSIKDGDEAIGQRLKESDDKLHSRVDRVKDEYVRRDDLHAHIARIEKSVDEVKDGMREQRSEQQRTNERLDTTLTSHTSMLQTMVALLRDQNRTPPPGV